MEDWALIRRLVADGVPQRQVARDLGIGRSTVEEATTVLNRDVFADIGISENEAGALAEIIESLRRSAGDF